MSNLRRLLFIWILLPFGALGMERAQGWCETGGQVVVGPGSSQSTTKVQRSYPQCIVHVYLTGTVTPATIFADNSSTPLSNPFTATSLGHWLFYAANGRYDVTISGSGLSSPFTFGDILLADPQSGPGGVSSISAGNAISVSSNTGGVTVTNTLEYLNSFYNFSQSPGGSLSIGSNTISMAPCPYLYTGNYVYVSGGTGTAEASIITGGTCTPGASSGTLIVTSANTHSGAWTISSASGGIEETLNYIYFAVGGSGKVSILSFTAIRAPVIMPPSGAYIVSGTGEFAFLIARATNFTSGNMFQHTTAANMTFRDLFIDNGQNNSTGDGAAFYTHNGTGSGINLGPMTLENVTITGGQYMVFCDSCRALTMTNVNMLIAGQSYEEDGLRVDCTNTGIQLGLITITNSYLSGLVNGAHIRCADGLVSIGGGAAGEIGWLLDGHDTRPIGHVLVTDFQIDGPSVAGIKLTGNGTIRSTIQFANGYIDGEYGISPESNIGVNIASGSWEDLSFTGLMIKNLGSWGFQSFAATGAKNLNLTNSQIVETALVNDSITGAINLASAQTGWNIQGNVTGNTALAGHSANGILLGGNQSAIMIVGNDLCNSTNPVSTLTFTIAGVVSNNECIDNTIPTVASATSIAAPLNPVIFLSGTTTTTTITGGRVGQQLTIISSSGTVTIGGGGNIPIAVTLVQNNRRVLVYDGTSWY